MAAEYQNICEEHKTQSLRALDTKQKNNLTNNNFSRGNQRTDMQFIYKRVLNVFTAKNFSNHK